MMRCGVTLISSADLVSVLLEYLDLLLYYEYLDIQKPPFLKIICF